MGRNKFQLPPHSKMDQNPIEEIKNKLNLVDVISSYIKLQKAGANFRAVCPFHGEKSGSFFVSPTRQIWHCFGCGKGGDVFGFVKEIEGIEFGDALRILAQKAGVELKKFSPEIAKVKSERQRLYEICELATKFFEKQLELSVTGKEARKYLLDRGLTEESIKKWRLGYAPDVWQGLSDFLSREYSQEEIKNAGLGLKSEKGSFYDRFRGRIIFPVFDLNSQVVGFGGRIFKKDDMAKYVNTPNTILYDKSRILYGLDKSKVAIRKVDSCILVEGYVDLIMASQVGTENVVANSGTALTSFQLDLLKRFTQNLITAYDMDPGGDSATKRGIDLAEARGFAVKVVVLPEGLDPADLISKDQEAWRKSVKEARSILDFYFETTFLRHNSQTPEGKRDIAKVLLPVLKRIPNRIVQAHWIQEMSKRMGVKEEYIEEELKKSKIENYSEAYAVDSERQGKTPEVKPKKELLEERITVLLMKAPLSTKEDVLKEDFSFYSPEIKEILVKLKESENIDPATLSPATASVFNRLALVSEIEEFEEKEILREIDFCLGQIKKIRLKGKIELILKNLQRAETEKNKEQLENLTQELNECSKSICDLDAKK